MLAPRRSAVTHAQWPQKMDVNMRLSGCLHIELNRAHLNNLNKTHPAAPQINRLDLRQYHINSLQESFRDVKASAETVYNV